MTLPTARLRVILEANQNNFFFFFVLHFSLRTQFCRPVKLPVTPRKATPVLFSFLFFVLRVVVLFILKNVFILLEIIVVSCYKIIDRKINAKKMSFEK